MDVLPPTHNLFLFIYSFYISFLSVIKGAKKSQCNVHNDMQSTETEREPPNLISLKNIIMHF